MQYLGVLPNERLFVGDGGSEELYGAKAVGMKTMFTEALETKSSKQRNNIIKNAVEQNRCAMACQGCGAVLLQQQIKKQWKILPLSYIVKLPHQTIKYGEPHCL